MNKKVISQESTVHGIRYFVDGENALHKLAWYFFYLLLCLKFIIICICICICIFVTLFRILIMVCSCSFLAYLIVDAWV